MSKLNQVPVALPQDVIISEAEQLTVKGGSDDTIITEDLVHE